MPQERKRKYAKYPDCFGKLRLGQLVEVAEKHGMLVMSGSKVGMHVFNEIGLYGTPSQMTAVESEWIANGHKMKPRSFRAIFGVNLKLPRSEWYSVQNAQQRKGEKP